MKRVALEKYLRGQGCHRVRHGSRHDSWTGPEGHPSVVARHREINPTMVRTICKQLGVSPPSSAA